MYRNLLYLFRRVGLKIPPTPIPPGSYITPDNIISRSISPGGFNTSRVHNLPGPQNLDQELFLLGYVILSEHIISPDMKFPGCSKFTQRTLSPVGYNVFGAQNPPPVHNLFQDIIFPGFPIFPEDKISSVAFILPRYKICPSQIISWRL